MTSSSTNPIQEVGEAWAAIYPLIHWVILHPFASVMVLLLGLYLVWVLLRALIYLTENLWIRLLKSPVWLLQTLWAGRQLPAFLFKEQADDETSQVRDRLQSLIHQLEASQREQAQILNLAKEELRKLNEG